MVKPGWLAVGGLALALGAYPSSAQAQLVTVTPVVGAYHPDGDLSAVRGSASSGTLIRDRSLALGLDIELAFLRGSAIYASGARIVREGVDDGNRIGSGSFLALTGDLMLRPLPRVLGFRPYGLAGAGVTRDRYSWDDDGVSDAFPEDKTRFALHVGVGADIMFSGIGLMVEASDYISRDGGLLGRHDSFIVTGLRLRLF
jgi:opacity protein-like surface antigen